MSYTRWLAAVTSRPMWLGPCPDHSFLVARRHSLLYTALFTFRLLLVPIPLFFLLRSSSHSTAHQYWLPVAFDLHVLSLLRASSPAKHKRHADVLCRIQPDALDLVMRWCKEIRLFSLCTCITTCTRSIGCCSCQKRGSSNRGPMHLS